MLIVLKFFSHSLLNVQDAHEIFNFVELNRIGDSVICWVSTTICNVTVNHGFVSVNMTKYSCIISQHCQMLQQLHKKGVTEKGFRNFVFVFFVFKITYSYS